MDKIKMVQFEYKIKPGTKTVWIEVSRESKFVDISFVQKFTDKETLKYFRNLGGSERVERDYTDWGYLPTKVSSISPDRKIKKITYFYVV